MTHEYTEAGLYDVIVSESLLLQIRAASLEQFVRMGRRYYVVLCDMLVKVAVERQMDIAPRDRL